MFIFEGLIFALTLFSFFFLLPDVLSIFGAIMLFFVGLVLFIFICNVIIYVHQWAVRH